MKRGFTLVELLAVILIIGIIATITTPIVLNVIGSAKAKGFEDSALSLLRASKNYYSDQSISDVIKLPLEIKFSDGNQTNTYTNSQTKKTETSSERLLEYSGTNPDSGIIEINSDGEVYMAIYSKSAKVCGMKSYTDKTLTFTKTSEEECVTTSVYAVSKIYMYSGKAIPSGVNVRTTPSKAMADWSDIIRVPANVFLKHKLVANKISESYVGFVITDETAKANDGIVAGTYYLKGGTGTYSSNVDLVKKIFDYDNHSDRCYSIDETDYEDFACKIDDIVVYITNGRVEVYDVSASYDYYSDRYHPSCVIYGGAFDGAFDGAYCSSNMPE